MELVGNAFAQKFLGQMVKQERVGSALLLAGPEGVGKGLFAVALAKQLLRSVKEHPPDLHVYYPEGRAALHTIDSMRDLAKEVFLPGLEAPCKVFVIDEADRMSSFAANALLKTLEEPTLDSLIVLVSSRPESLLPTIRSRCRTVYFGTVDEAGIREVLQAHGGDPEWAWLARGRPAFAVQLARSSGDPLRELLLDLLQVDPARPFGAIRDGVKRLGDGLEQLRKVELPASAKELSAQQREAYSRQLEGRASLVFLRECERLLREFVMWFRDGYLRQMGIESGFYHRDRSSTPRIPPLLPLSRDVARAGEALARFTKPAVVFEALFLKYL